MKRIVVGVLVAVGLLAAMPLPAHAVTINASQLNLGTTCDFGTSAAFTGQLPLPADTYDVYVRLPAAGQTAMVTAYGQVSDLSTPCVSVGTVTANGSSWTKIGEWSEGNVSEQTIFLLASNELVSTLDANRPSLMLVSQTNPPCTPTTDCTVTIDGQPAAIEPIGTLPNQDSLHVVRVIDPSTDQVKQVTYYVDNDPVYTTPTLQPFDMRYVAYPNQQLARVITYQSGQEVVLSSTSPDTFSDSFFNFLFRLYQTNPKAIIVTLIILVLWGLAAIALAIFHTVRRHRVWSLDHGLAQEHVQLVTGADRRRAFLAEHRWAIIRPSLMGASAIAAMVVVILFVNSYIVTLYRVDGHSMESTYKNGTEQIVDKIPVSLAHLEGVQYVPPRGTVVIVREVFGIANDQQAGANENKYLIKRVIGLPGERVVAKGGHITVYNQAHPNGFNPDAGSSWAKTMHQDDSATTIDVTLGKDEIFIAGDNRPVSVDSRFNGPMLTQQIIGIVN